MDITEQSLVLIQDAYCYVSDTSTESPCSHHSKPTRSNLNNWKGLGSKNRRRRIWTYFKDNCPHLWEKGWTIPDLDPQFHQVTEQSIQ
ncbi:hypothetical protein PISMIDRAFT_418461 [Pisolithus microcarpus 441]|uniref:Uncharacterized protein n=1 Tax=Pisolithus microcarpus 441 TaxID=765257 RepID=A0A0C9YGK6_9AGAM|nr:hypothetical protein PISMIDRAFT_418461 [Pisolithus microcarpus 441]